MIPLHRYIAEAERALAALPSPKRVFVASDSAEAIEAFVSGAHGAEARDAFMARFPGAEAPLLRLTGDASAPFEAMT